MGRGVAVTSCSAAATVGLLLGLCGCLDPTQITIEIHTDVPCDEYDDTSIALGLTGPVETMDPVARTSACDDEGTVGSLVAIPSDSDELLGIKVVAATDGLDVDLCVAPDYADGCIVARRALHFVDHTPLRLPIAMRSVCINQFCEVGTTCVDGQCAPAVITNPSLCADEDGCPEDELPPPQDTGPLVLSSPGDARRPRIVHTDDGWAVVWLTDTLPYYALLSDGLDGEVIPPTARGYGVPTAAGPELVFTAGRVVVASGYAAPNGSGAAVESFPPTAPWSETPGQNNAQGQPVLGAVGGTVLVASLEAGANADFFAWYDDPSLTGSNWGQSVSVAGSDAALALVDPNLTIVATWEDGGLVVAAFFRGQSSEPNGYVNLGQNVEQRAPALAIGAPNTNDPSVAVAWADTSGTLHLVPGHATLDVMQGEVALQQPAGTSWTEPSLAWGDGAFYLAWTYQGAAVDQLAMVRIPRDSLEVSQTVKVTTLPNAAEPTVAVDQAQAHVAVAWVAEVNGAQQVHVQRFGSDLTTP